MTAGACPTNEPVPRERPLSDFVPIGLAVLGRNDSAENPGSIRRLSITSRTFDFLPVLAAVEEDRFRVTMLLPVLGLQSAA